MLMNPGPAMPHWKAECFIHKLFSTDKLLLLQYVCMQLLQLLQLFQNFPVVGRNYQ